MKLRPEPLGTTADRLPSLAGLRVLVVGLGRLGGGIGVTRWLARQGASVTVTDQAGGDTLAASVRAVTDLDIELHLGGHDPRDLDNTDLVVINPAVIKGRSDFFREIVRRKIAWTTEMNLFCERFFGKVIGVTGTYGKSTTCAMLAEALEACRAAGAAEYTGVHLGGNIGRCLLPELDTIRPTDLVVLEMSSAQLEDLSRIDWAPSIAVITNISRHHLDRYDAHSDYVAAKLNIIGDAKITDKVILGYMDAEAETILRRKLVDFGSSVVRVTLPEPPVELRLPGDHNQANVACVLAVCHHLGLDEAVVRDAMRLFKGLPHRLEYVRTLDGVDYYNDSKSTSPASTIRAVEALGRPVVAIVGGKLVRDSNLAPTPDLAPAEDAQPNDRLESLSHIGNAVSAGDNVCGTDFPVGQMTGWKVGPTYDLRGCAQVLVRSARPVICIGESGPVFAEAVRGLLGPEDPGRVRLAGGLVEAIQIARAAARPGDAVLFSPGAPSFDAYANFVDRGRHFLDAVNALTPEGG